jgi:hypothetical protein
MPKKANAAGTLLLASMQLPSARRLAEVAKRQGWRACVLDESPTIAFEGDRTFYGGTDKASLFAVTHELCLIEPPLDLLTKVPAALLARQVRFGTLGELAHVRCPVFVKPADPVLKVFEPGVYGSVADVQGRSPLAAATPILISEPVDWTSEFRCFVREGRLETWSPYVSFGRPMWKAGIPGDPPANLAAFVDRLMTQMRGALPPAFVVDIGVLEDGRWAVVEFNPAWCSGILGANVEAIFKVIQRAAVWKRKNNVDHR